MNVRMSFLGDLVDFVTPSFQMVVQCNEITYLLHNCFILFVVVVCCWGFVLFFCFWGWFVRVLYHMSDAI